MKGRGVLYGGGAFREFPAGPASTVEVRSADGNVEKNYIHGVYPEDFSEMTNGNIFFGRNGLLFSAF